mmetsp:Transcript_11510/g.17342  ORF Transcript_11510/g.17342 Transcript_11510/m.17342 type:complete len:105 (+) Transcript_11510:756-1070(+)
MVWPSAHSAARLKSDPSDHSVVKLFPPRSTTDVSTATVAGRFSFRRCIRTPGALLKKVKELPMKAIRNELLAPESPIALVCNGGVSAQFVEANGRLILKIEDEA